MFFKRTELMRLPNGCRDCLILPGETFRFDFSIPERKGRTAYSLRVIGETDEFWKWRAECGNPYWLAESVEDLLETEDTPREKFAMKISANGEVFERNAWMLLKKDVFTPGRNYSFEVAGKSENLEILPGGEACVELGIYLAKRGRAEDDVFDMPDLVRRISLKPGSTEWESFRDGFLMPETAVALLVRIGVKNAKGTACFGSPRLYPEGCDNLIPPFDTTQTRFPEYNWLGENLDRRDHPEFVFKADGKVFFRGEKYSPIYRRPDFTLDLPELEPGGHTLEITAGNAYERAVGFVLQGLELLEEGAEKFEVVASPEFIPENTPCPVLIRTREENLEISGTVFPEKGLHVFLLPPMAAGAGREITLEAGDVKQSFSIRSVVRGKSDGIRLSTSDAVFIHQSVPDFTRYLEWYVSNRIGNTMRFRCCYRWSGSRACDPEVWKTIVPLLEKLDMDYVVQIDGRELPGKNANPPDDLVAGPHYLGRQAHENDGSMFYWGNSLWGRTVPPEPQTDILARSIDYGGIQPHIRPPRSADGRVWRFFDPTDARDRREASEKFIANLAAIRGPATRHSGPSALFRFFFRAGYDYLEAEQMYGPEELILSALRGASKACGKTEFGAHLATQWSSTPHDTFEHAERYFLSLAACYLQGATQMNIEEGLWRMEKDWADYDRFSGNCLRHLAAHTRFRRFLQTHRRTGKMVVPVGVVQGRYDGWSCFCRENVWRREGAEWKFSSPEKSFDLLKLFYPRSVLSAIYECPCSVEPHGWYTGTPSGVPDLFPFEGSFGAYRAVIFLGWHTFETGDAEKLLDYVEKGGTLLLTRKHLSTAVKHSEKTRLEPSPALEKLLGENWMAAKKTIRRKCGSGRVVFDPSDRYPAQTPESYAAEMRMVAEAAIRPEFERGWVRANEDVNFTVWDDSETGMRTIYLLNIRWWSPEDSAVGLLLNGREIPLTVPYGRILVVKIANRSAAVCSEDLADILEFDGSRALIQSPEPGTVQFLGADGSLRARAFPAGITEVKR